MSGQEKNRNVKNKDRIQFVEMSRIKYMGSVCVSALYSEHNLVKKLLIKCHQNSLF